MHTNISPEQFGIEVSRLLKERKLTQRGLAEYLGLTSPSVCYLLHNKLRPSRKQFDGIMEYLKADASTIVILKDLWMATQKNSEKRNNINENLFALRCEHGFNFQEVSAGTGITVDRLSVLENDPDSDVSPQELELIKGFYGVNSIFPFGSSNVRQGDFVAEDLPENSYCAKTLPILNMETFSRLSGKRYLAAELESMNLPKGFRRIDAALEQRSVALLICDAKSLHYGIPGTLELIIGENSGEFRDLLYIGRGSRGAISMFRMHKHRLEYFGFASPPPKISCTTVFPVLEFKFIAAQQLIKG